jgi:hypothetical protein
MKTTYKYLIPIAAVAAITSGVYGAQQVSAATSPTTTGVVRTSLVDRLVSTFGLDKSKVQAVIDADRTQHEADREATAQKALILAEHSKIQAEREANRDSSATEDQAQRKASMTATKAEVDAWASTNGISASYLGGGHGGGHEGGEHQGE